jgi:hypothetical protein
MHLITATIPNSLHLRFKQELDEEMSLLMKNNARNTEEWVLNYGVTPTHQNH